MAKGRAVAVVLDDVQKAALLALIANMGATIACVARPHCACRSERADERGNRGEAGCLCSYLGVLRNRFARDGLDGLYDEPRPGAHARLATT